MSSRPGSRETTLSLSLDATPRAGPPTGSQSAVMPPGPQPPAKNL